MILVNFKTYPEGSGEEAVSLAKICAEVSDSSNVEIIVAVQAVDAFRIKQAVPSLKVYAQHVDSDKSGQATGSINIEALKKVGVSGSLLNHFEKMVNFEDALKSLKRAKDLDFEVCLCIKDADLGNKFLNTGADPDWFAIEPPELIGGDISVVSANPNIIQKGVSVIGSEKLLIGAGIKTSEDVEKALELGASGVLVSSGVVLSDDPKKVLENLISPFGKRV